MFHLCSAAVHGAVILGRTGVHIYFAFLLPLCQLLRHACSEPLGAVGAGSFRAEPLPAWSAGATGTNLHIKAAQMFFLLFPAVFMTEHSSELQSQRR